MLTDEAFERMIELGERFEAGVNEVIAAHDAALARDPAGLPGRVRVPRHAAAKRIRGRGHSDRELDRFMHLHALNRGILMTPFHNMALMCPATTEADVDLPHARLRRGGRGAFSGARALRPVLAQFSCQPLTCLYDRCQLGGPGAAAAAAHPSGDTRATRDTDGCPQLLLPESA